jgi:KipI family sensor histidine kinase inhibitor
MRLLPYGDAAVLAEVADLDAALSLYAALRADPAHGVTDVVPAARTVLVRLDPARTTARDVARWLRSVPPQRPTGLVDEQVEIPVVYDGQDLDEIAAAAGWSRRDLVSAHCGQPWRVGFVGFAPGFAYLIPSHDWPALPRRPEPRAAVPAGSVGVADRYTGIYPRRSPGGWSILGRTTATLWDPGTDPPALLRPGGTVTFVDAT